MSLAVSSVADLSSTTMLDCRLLAAMYELTSRRHNTLLSNVYTYKHTLLTATERWITTFLKVLTAAAMEYTVCTRIQVDPHISNRLPNDVADAINSVPRDAAV